MAPGGQLQGARATAAAVGTRVAGTPGPLRVQVTLRDMDQLRQQLAILASNSPTDIQLLAMVQDASGLMFELSQEVPAMTPNQLDQALGKMADITTEMSRVVQTHASQMMGMATPGTMTPGAMVGTPGAGGTPTPFATVPATTTPGVVGARQLMAAIQQLDQQEMNLASDQPTYEDITNVLGQMNQLLMSIRSQLRQLSAADLQDLTASMGQAMADLEPVIRTRIRMDVGVVPTVAPNQTVLPTLAATPTLGPTTVPPATATPVASPAPATPTSAAATPTSVAVTPTP